MLLSDIHCEQHHHLFLLGVDGDDRDVVDEGLLDKADPQAGFPADGCADDDGVGGEVPGGVKQGVGLKDPGFRITGSAEVVECAEFFLVLSHEGLLVPKAWGRTIPNATAGPPRRCCTG